MAQPPAYNRTKDFTEDFGSETDHTALNAELDKASNSINDIRRNIALMQADDGKLRENAITTDSLSQSVLDYVQAQALAGANAVADQATDIASRASAKADNAVALANGAVAVAEQSLAAAQSASATAGSAVSVAEGAVASADAALAETALIDGKVSAAVSQALLDVEVPGLSAQTIANALGFVPYDGMTNPRQFAFVEQLPEVMAGAGEGVDGMSGLVPAPSAGERDSFLRGDGTWNSVDMSGYVQEEDLTATLATTLAGYATQDDLDSIEIPEVTSESIISALGYTPVSADGVNSIPSGVICMWSGDSDAVPAGWYLCDGQNGTPDLRNRFIVGAGSTYTVGATGGATSNNITVSGTSGATTLTIDQMPKHTHNVSDLYSGSGRKYDATNNSGGSSQITTTSTGGSGSHTHSFSKTVSVPSMPPYYALCYIMKG